MKSFYCPICGNLLPEEYAHGDICGCCANECIFDEMKLFEKAKYGREFNVNLLDEISDLIPKSHLDKLREAKEFSDLTLEEYREILRYIWVNKGCDFKYNDYNEKPNNWGMDMAKKQLLNIKVDLDDYKL